MPITKQNWEQKLGDCQQLLKDIGDQLKDLAADFGEIARRASDAGYQEGRNSVKEELND